MQALALYKEEKMLHNTCLNQSFVDGEYDHSQLENRGLNGL
jgi:hypothetical protein